MTITVTNTGITNKSYYSRGLITHRATTSNLVRLTDGTLWAAVKERHLRGDVSLYRSTDGGFSWDNIFRDSFPTGLGWGTTQTIRSNESANGPFLSLTVFEELNRLILWHAVSVNQAPVRIWPFIFDLTTGARIEEAPEAPPSNATNYNVDADSMAIKVAYNENSIYVCYVKEGFFRIRTFSPNRVIADRGDHATNINGHSSAFDVSARTSGLVDIAVERGGTIYYTRYDERTGTFSSPVSVGAGSSATDVNIQRDGQGHLLIAWSSGQTMTYVRSTNGGNSWTTNNIQPSGSVFTDSITGQIGTRLHSLPGIEGFLISYTRSSGTFVRTLQGDQLGGERKVGTQSHPNQQITGAKFFDTPAGRHIDLSQPGWVRIAFQVGQGNSATGLDTVPVKFAQESLNESAFPTQSTEVPGLDTPTLKSQTVNLKVLDGPSSNLDYFEEGAIGPYTHRSASSFNRVGTPLRFLRYEPNRDAEVGDRSSYNAPEEFLAPAVVMPMSYNRPFAATQDDFTTFIERDARRIHVPPTLHFSRQFVLNEGNHLKRTVWTVYFGGNEYEISQVVPSFIKGQITHYTANMYVIGPSYDPFSRKTLPSET